MDMESMAKVWLPASAVNSPLCFIPIRRQATVPKAHSVRPTMRRIASLDYLGWTAGSQVARAQLWSSKANL